MYTFNLHNPIFHSYRFSKSHEKDKAVFFKSYTIYAKTDRPTTALPWSPKICFVLQKIWKISTYILWNKVKNTRFMILEGRYFFFSFRKCFTFWNRINNEWRNLVILLTHLQNHENNYFDLMFLNQKSNSAKCHAIKYIKLLQREIFILTIFLIIISTFA